MWAVLRICAAIILLFSAQPVTAQDGFYEWKSAYQRAFDLLLANRPNESIRAFEEAYASALKHFGPGHEYTAVTARYLAEGYRALGREAEANAVEERKRRAEHSALEGDDPRNIGALNTLAREKIGAGRFDEAVPILKKVAELSKKINNGNTIIHLTALRDLANAYQYLDNHDNARKVLVEAVALQRQVLYEYHRDVIGVRATLIYLLAASDLRANAVDLLREIHPDIIKWLKTELYNVNNVVSLRSATELDLYLDMALTLANMRPIDRQAQLAVAEILIQTKAIMAEEEAHVAKLARRSDRPAVKQAAEEIALKREKLAAAFNNSPSDYEYLGDLFRDLDEAESKLARLGENFENRLRAAHATLRDVREAVPDNSVVIEFHQYDHQNFNLPMGADHNDRRWAALFVDGAGDTGIVDLGSVDNAELHIDQVLNETRRADDSAQLLFKELISELPIPAGTETLYISPGDKLYLLPFHRLMNSDGRYLTELYRLRIVATARDLLRPVLNGQRGGLLALGGIDFGKSPEQLSGSVGNGSGQANDEIAALRSFTDASFRSGFEQLPQSGPEVRQIEQLYRQARPEEGTEVWLGSDASEARLKRLPRAPRTLHLATHGFYGAWEDFRERPMILAGVTLAGANVAGRSQGHDDGILYAIEAQDLNLDGTELVVLSACETAQGVVAYGEGVFGMARALRIAGARNVLVTSRPVSDESAPEFMERFYRNWLSQDPGSSDPAAALQATQAYYIANEPDFEWSPYMLIGTSTEQPQNSDREAQHSSAVVEIPSNSVERALELDKADWVDIQVALALMEIDPGVIDGKATEETRGAIQRWQEQNGLAVTGFLTGDQWSQLLQLGEQVASQMR